jgi:outer membrane protein OmpA-like peptidoglycan-associated protein
MIKVDALRNFVLLFAIFILVLAILLGCSSAPIPGPDKQGAGTFGGMLTGAGTGAVTGFHASAATGPGVAIGAGFGAIAGGIQGAVLDIDDEEAIRLRREIKLEQERSVAQKILADHYKRRLMLYPQRDIFPADVFFDSDSATPNPTGKALIAEIARINKKRATWSRIVISVYNLAGAGGDEYATKFAERRAKNLGDLLIKGGVNGRRVKTRGIPIAEPLLDLSQFAVSGGDPSDHDSSSHDFYAREAMRYSQVVEFSTPDI